MLYVDLNSPSPAQPYADWSTAATNIQDAIDASSDGDLILVTNGIYQTGGQVEDYYGNDFSNRVLIDKPLTVRSVNGPSVTVILGNPVSGPGGVRCVYMADAAVLSGFTLKNGGTMDYFYWAWAFGEFHQQSGGGVYCSAPTALVTNCVITGCVAYVNGGGAANGILKNCTLTNNTAGSSGGGAVNSILQNCSLLKNQGSGGGGGTEGGALTNCVLSGNSAAGNGGGAENSVLVNCALAGNFSQANGGGILGGTAINCTITANTAMNSGGGAGGSTLNNCILLYNTSLSGANFTGCTLNLCCTTPMPDDGTNNFSADPQLLDSAHLKANSPGIGAGSAIYTSGADIDGEAWANPPSIGCDEFYSGAATGPLMAAIQTSFTNVAANFPASFTGIILGHATNVVWNFGDGTFATNQLSVSHSWNAPGNYPVILTALNGSNPGGVSATFTVHVVAQPVFYVRANNASPSAPFNSWATAATNIQDAVDAVTVPGSLVLVTNGVYQDGGRTAYGSLTNRVAVTVPMLVRSVNGAAATVIAGNPVIGGDAVRCVYLANGAMLAGFTLTNGATLNGGAVGLEQSGGGVRCESSGTIVSNCVIAGNVAYDFGGGIEGGTILNSTISGNRAVSGGGSHGAEVNNSVFSLNPASSVGGAVKSCTVKNSALTANSTHASGGAADGCTLVNCTVSGNYAGISGGGANNSTLNNCIVYFNTAPAGTNISSSVLNFCCTTPLPSSGANNTTADPLLTDNAHIGGSSPCIGAGSANFASGADIDGDAWSNPPSIGCDESYTGAVTTSLIVSALANYTNVAVGFPVNLSGLVSGHSTGNSWNFGDSTIVSNQIYAAHSWSSPGDYVVTFATFNDANPGGVSATISIHVTSQIIFYVDANGTNPIAPFNSWATAATNIQDAADAAGAGGTVLVNDGFYQFGGSVAFGLLTNRVACVRPMTLQSVNGPEATVIAGNYVADDTAVRGVWLVNGCAMSGFTVTNGAARSAGDVNLEQSGGGVWCESAGVFVSNCVFTVNYVPQYGGGAFGGTLSHCVFTNNSAGNGGGAYSAILNDCSLGANSGNGAVQCTLNHCTLISNSGSGAVSCVLSNCFLDGNGGNAEGGGVNSCTVFDSTISGSSVSSDGGGAAWSTLVGCVLSNNLAGYEGGGAQFCTLSNCMLVGNHAWNLGGGARSCTLDHCTFINNGVDVGDGGGAFDCTLNNSTLTGNHANAYGGGACVSTVNNCVLSGNSATDGGGFSGVSSGTPGRGNSLSNCAVFGNSATKGGGLESCVAVNCTITGNYAVSSGGGAEMATLDNCIVYHNYALTQPEYEGGILNYCCTLPLPPAGSGNITNEPQLADFAHISSGSPCRSAGSAAYTGGVDIDGEAWLNPPSMGCDEFYSGAATGALAVSILADYTNCASGFAVSFIGQITGHAAGCIWNFGDGTSATNQLYPAHNWSGGGDYTVTFTAFNDSNPGGVSASVVIHVLQVPVYYVSLDSTNPILPFNSWATAATNIQDAVDAAVAGGTVLVTNGDYNVGGRVVFGAMTNRVAVNKPMTVRSVNGPALTAIEGFTANDNTSIRCIYLTNDAALFGFTLTNGATSNGGDGLHEWAGAGVWCEASGVVVSNCIFVNNTAGGYGGGAYGGTLFNCAFTNNYGYDGGAACFSSLNHCTLANNRGYYGGGAYGSTLLDCTLTGNFTYVDSDYTANGGGASGCTLTNCVLAKNSSNNGGGASGSTLINCVLTGNTSDGVYFAGGGGASGSTLVNCTVVGNTCINAGGGGVVSSVLTNCIVYFNNAASAPNYSDDSVLSYCDAMPLATNGGNNISSDPLFADPVHINFASPCRDAGSAAATSGVDIDGDAWLNPPSIGCDEFNSSSATGALAVAISATFTNVAAGFTVDFAAHISGHATANVWDFGDGTIVSNTLFFTHSWAAAGKYTVTLAAFNTDNPGGVGESVTIFILQNPVHYVSLDSTTPVAPYLSWVTAATNIQDAVDAAFTGGTIIVSNGVYQNGARYVLNGSTNRVAVTKQLTLQSLNGAAATVIDGSDAGSNAVRCLYLTNHVSVTGFTLRNGLAVNGGGVFCQGDDVLNDCALIGNSSPYDWTSGGGAYGGILNHCTFTGNSASYLGAAAVYAGLNFCVVSNNGPVAYGGAGLQCGMINCVIVSNMAAWGGGVVNCEADNCLLLGNAALYGGGGAIWSTLNNCTVVGNTVPSVPGTYGGAGIYDGTANNCVICYNNGDNWTADWEGISMNHDCTTPGPGGIGNITGAPLFADLAAGDFHLQTNSPCINSGNNAYTVGTNDLDGFVRVTGGTVDIGAYEFQTPSSILSYAWAQQFGLPTDGSADNADADGDGMKNWQESRAGTNPTNAASLLQMLSTFNNVSGATVTWQSVSGINYFIQRGYDLSAEPSFTTIQSNIVGQAGTTSYTDTTATNGGPFFYRVGVQ